MARRNMSLFIALHECSKPLLKLEGSDRAAHLLAHDGDESFFKTKPFEARFANLKMFDYVRLFRRI